METLLILCPNLEIKPLDHVCQAFYARHFKRQCFFLNFHMILLQPVATVTCPDTEWQRIKDVKDPSLTGMVVDGVGLPRPQLPPALLESWVRLSLGVILGLLSSCQKLSPTGLESGPATLPMTRLHTL